jgi:hypothetical protein
VPVLSSRITPGVDSRMLHQHGHLTWHIHGHQVSLRLPYAKGALYQAHGWYELPAGRDFVSRNYIGITTVGFSRVP